MVIFNLKIESMILNSMSHIVKVFGDVATAPKLNFKLHFAGSKCISAPSVSEILDQYCSILSMVSFKYIFVYNITTYHV